MKWVALQIRFVHRRDLKDRCWRAGFVVNSAGQEMITLTPSTFGGEIAIWAARPGGARSDQPSVRMAVHAPETAMLDLRNGFDEDGERVLATAFGFPANCSVNVVSRDGESQTRMHISRHHPHQGFVAVSSGDVEATAQMVPEKK
ncbi:MAG: hypothetical protein R3F49_17480 [Planctomycetota bacterium]